MKKNSHHLYTNSTTVKSKKILITFPLGSWMPLLCWRMRTLGASLTLTLTPSPRHFFLERQHRAHVPECVLI